MRSRPFPTVLLLAGACSLLRLPHLRVLPIFGDEAIHLHWAQLVQQDPIRNAFISLQDPKPPFHFWLLALFLPLSSDPVLSGRLLSVVAGALSVSILFLLARDLARYGGASRPSPERIALAVCVLFLFCPFVAFSQRMALAESLFLLETLLAAYCSLRLATVCAGGSPHLRSSLGLGLVMGVAMLTRQNFSYVLWALPLLAWFIVTGPRRPGAFFSGFGASLLLAAVLWTPMLLVRAGPDLKTRVFHVAAYRQPVSLGQRAHHAREVFSWLVAYMTPPVFILALVSFVWLAAARRGRAAAFLASWLLLIVAPLLLFASLLFPRYLIGAAIPLLLAGGFLAAELWEGIGRRLSRWRAAFIRLVAAGALLAWPAVEILRQCTDWKGQTLVPIDRWQYVTGWPAGYATEQAVRFLLKRMEETPLVVVTPQISGNPTDAVWVLLRDQPGILLYATGDVLAEPILPEVPGSRDRFLLRGDLREGGPALPRPVPSSAEVYFVSPDPIATRSGEISAKPFFEERNPGIREVARFENPIGSSNRVAAVSVFRLP